MGAGSVTGKKGQPGKTRDVGSAWEKQFFQVLPGASQGVCSLLFFFFFSFRKKRKKGKGQERQIVGATRAARKGRATFPFIEWFGSRCECKGGRLFFFFKQVYLF